MRRLAEDGPAYSPLPPGGERVEGEGWKLSLAPVPYLATVAGVRLGAGVGQAVADVRAELTARQRTNASWWAGESATPADLAGRLRALELRPEQPPDAPDLVPMALLEPPPDAPPGFTARRVESFEEFATAAEIRWKAWETPAELREVGRSRLEPRCAGQADPAFELPDARGREAYRALIRGRWDEAERRGIPGLVVQAGPESREILARVGFRALGRIQVLVNEGPW